MPDFLTSPDEIRNAFKTSLTNDGASDATVLTGIGGDLGPVVGTPPGFGPLKTLATKAFTDLGAPLASEIADGIHLYIGQTAFVNLKTETLRIALMGNTVWSEEQMETAFNGIFDSLSDADLQSFLDQQGGSVSLEVIDTTIDGALQAFDTSMTEYLSEAQNLAAYRFLNEANGSHFYTASEQEKDLVLETMPSFKFEGRAFVTGATPDTGVAVHRGLNTETGHHFFTTNDAEIQYLQQSDNPYTYEGIVFYAFADSSGTNHDSVARLYNPETGKHLYAATDVEEYNAINTLGFQKEADVFYVDFWFSNGFPY
ncbi:hypothetical protein [Labrenzia sp. PHM005]|uniref:hypothetical protein n=1 Tax=Labrenzia sp. PHM005 TaxID=2590016 RepID=UPI0011407A00|nr:hypothetical protein [Labrenzia sp. PHM005]QDG77520.1 hypothetical protein FJ695_17515 [Labrenzia sp. PHM005]